MSFKTSGKILSLLLALCLLFIPWPYVAARAETAPQAQTYTAEIPIRTAADDLEERADTGEADAGSRDIALGCEVPRGGEAQPQIVGLRFTGLPIFRGATVTGAYIQFTVDEAARSSVPFDVTIAAEAAADSAPFRDGDALPRYALSSRARTAQSVRWAADEGDPIVWKTKGQAGRAQRTPDLSALVQAVIDGDGWAYGNAMTFLLAGSGSRIAVAYERNRSDAATLHIDYAVVNENQPAPTGLSGSAPTTLFRHDGVLAGTDAAMEYRPAGDGSARWTPCAGSSVTGLAAGDYEVRYAGKVCFNPGTVATVNVPLYAGDLTLQPGADETEMGFAWYLNARQAKAAVLQVAPASAVTDGSFPAAAARTFTGAVAKVKGFLSNEATATGLEPDTEYVYRVGDGANWSNVFRFSTRDARNYGILFVGDPQVGSGGSMGRDSLGWQTTLGKALTAFPDTSFILSSGDQVEYWSNEKQYAAFFGPAALRSLPLAPTIGNHDDGTLFAYHYALPNETAYGRSNGGYDYWFVYGNTLFLMLNSNNRSVPTHDAFLREAVAAAGDGIVWKVVVFHHSIYSSAAHSLEDCITFRRDELYPLMDKYGIDVALAGHDHRYTRSYQMLDGKAQNGLESFAVNPEGTVYVTAGSASGSKYYNMQGVDIAYRAVRMEDKEPSYCYVTVGDGALTVTTCLPETGEVFDRYTIVKDPTVPAFLKGIAPTADGADDGMILGVTAGMEYRRASAREWTACAGTAIAGLAPGLYAVRYQGVAGAPGGKAVTVAVPGFGLSEANPGTP